MKIEELSFKDVKIITPQVFVDERGFFLELFHQRKYEELGLPKFVQDNLSYSKYGTIRGMHFQTFPGQAKLITVVKGKIFDVFVDIRKGSKTYGKWSHIELDDESHLQLFLPVGFAHGFCCISSDAIVQYKVSHYYEPSTEKGFRYNDPIINIDWPVKQPIVSERDATAPFLGEICYG